MGDSAMPSTHGATPQVAGGHDEAGKTAVEPRGALTTVRSDGAEVLPRRHPERPWLSSPQGKPDAPFGTMKGAAACLQWGARGPHRQQRRAGRASHSSTKRMSQSWVVSCKP